MKLMRADMGMFLNGGLWADSNRLLGGAASVVSTAWAVAKLKLPYVFSIDD
jgi:hypothetical protein